MALRYTRSLPDSNRGALAKHLLAARRRRVGALRHVDVEEVARVIAVADAADGARCRSGNSALAMDIESNPEEEEQQEPTCGTAGCDFE
eukprot:1578315-Prymnesium_polylepis.1